MRTKTFALLAVFAFGLCSGAAHADGIGNIRLSPTTGPHDGGSDPCVVLCVPPDEPGNPGTPGGPGAPPSPKGLEAAFRGCGDKLGHLGRVTVQQIEGVRDGRSVHLVPLCDTVNHSLSQEQAAYLARGNTQGLIAAIGGNGVLAGKLGSKGYDANDVVGVAVGSNATILYVSRR